MDRGDVRVAQGGEDVGLALEPCEPFRVLGDSFRQYFDRHLTPEPGVLGAVDLSHATLAELGSDLELGKCLTDHLR